MAQWIEDPQGRLEVEKVTKEIKLPVWKPNYKGRFRDFWNECWDKIEDSFLKLKKSNEGKEPAIENKETAFNKAFGTVEDTVLEGNKFTQMTGKDYGGILNEPGAKLAGKAYWDNNTKKLYICKNNNSDISPNVNNYVPFDSNSLLERLENLFTYESASNWQTLPNCDGMSASIYIADKIMIQTITYSFNKKIDNTRLYFPKPFKKSPFVSITDNDLGAVIANSSFAMDWATETYINIKNTLSGFTMLAIGII